MDTVLSVRQQPAEVIETVWGSLEQRVIVISRLISSWEYASKLV